MKVYSHKLLWLLLFKNPLGGPETFFFCKVYVRRICTSKYLLVYVCKLRIELCCEESCGVAITKSRRASPPTRISKATEICRHRTKANIYLTRTAGCKHLGRARSWMVLHEEQLSSRDKSKQQQQRGYMYKAQEQMHFLVRDVLPWIYCFALVIYIVHALSVWNMKYS